MGISGLLPALKSITETKSLEEYRGKTLAIDGYCWLHRAIYSCSQEICLGQETDKYIKYFLDRVDMLLHHGITPYVVFDGGPLPMKKGTEIERRAARQKNRERGVQLFKERNYSEARKHFSRAADVSPYMAHRVIQHLKARNVRYVVAPYEADAQLAYLTQNGLADGVITEDSDCLPFGCGTVLFKLEKDGVGLAQEIKESNLKHNKGLLFHMFTPEMFLEMCIFSGCDYLPSLSGFGLKKAYAALKQHGSFAKVIRALRLEGKVRIPVTYEADFEKAVLTFRHQRVFDPVAQRLVHLTPIRDSGEMSDAAAMDFLGPMLADDVAAAIAHGNMDPITMERFSTNASASFVATTMTATTTTTHIFASAGSARQSSYQTNRFASAGAAQSRKPTHMFAATAHQQQQQQQQGRRLPGSFAHKSDSPLSSVAKMFRSHTSASVASRALETSPPVVSRFFTAQPKRATSSDESEDAIALSVASASFESQEPLEVDVARSVSLAPVEDKTRAHGVVFENKENRTPPRGTAVPAPASSAPVPVVKENAFARMMRAGSLLQKQSLKRKASGAASFRHGKQSGGLLGHHQRQQQQRPVEQRIQRFAHIESTQSSVVVVVQTETLTDTPSPETADDAMSTLTAEPEAESATVADINEGDDDATATKCASQDSSSVVAHGSCLAAAARYSPRRARSKALVNAAAPRATPSMLASLDRFRFKP